MIASETQAGDSAGDMHGGDTRAIQEPLLAREFNVMLDGLSESNPELSASDRE